MMTVTVTVPGKVLVSGEHAVVYGEPAIVAAIDLTVTVELVPAKQFGLESERADDLGLVRHALETCGFDPEKMKVKVVSSIPSKMGTSAALCAGVIKAAHLSYGKKLTKKGWFDLTWKCEKKAHWNSSGVDPAAVVYGGLIWYVRGKQLKPWEPLRRYPMLLVDSGSPVESTGEMVEGLAKRAKREPGKYRHLIKEVGRTTTKTRKQMEKGEQIANEINLNGRLLEELGVVGERARAMSKEFRGKGWGVKITGAGGIKEGSGRLLVVGAGLEEVRQLGYEAFGVTIGGSK